MTTDPLLDPNGVAAHLGVEASTIRKYVSQGRMPVPDVQVGNSRAWKQSTIDRWQASRPGPGNWGAKS